jgi:hypothetical protein
MSRTMLCNAALMVWLSNFYSSFKPNFSRIFCSSFKFFEHQTVRLSRVHCIYVYSSSSKVSFYFLLDFHRNWIWRQTAIKVTSCQFQLIRLERLKLSHGQRDERTYVAKLTTLFHYWSAHITKIASLSRAMAEPLKEFPILVKIRQCAYCTCFFCM